MSPGWRGGPDRDGVGGEQISDLDFAEAGPAGDGPVQGGAAHLHPGAQVLPGQTVRLLLPRGLPVRVRTTSGSSLKSDQMDGWSSDSGAFFFCCLLSAAVEENAYNRMKKVVKWYISGFYKKPKVSRGHWCSGAFVTLLLCIPRTSVLHGTVCRFTGVEETLQPHHRRDVPLPVAPPEDQQQDLLHRRAGELRVQGSNTTI